MFPPGPQGPPPSLNSSLSGPYGSASKTTSRKPYDIDSEYGGALQPYTPTPDEAARVSEVDNKFEQWQRVRRPHEQQWFINAAFWRGQQYVEWNTLVGLPVTAPAPQHRIRLVINKIFPKIRARQAKFLKGRAKPMVRPFTSDLEAREDARMTEKALDYYWRKAQLDAAYQDTLDWSSKTGHGYWWLSWDPTVMGKVKVVDELTQQSTIEEATLGDVSVETDGTYSLLVADPSISRLGKQPQIMRIKIRSLDYVRSRFPEKGQFVQGEMSDITGLRFERQLAILNPIGGGGSGGDIETKAGRRDDPKKTIVKELFTAPSGDFPKGRYCVVANGVLLKEQDELPYGFWDIKANPYPVVDFPDLTQTGQYWITTVLEQLITPQREYNLIRSKVAEQIRINAHPKILVAVQHRIPASAWTSAPGEMIPYVAQPNIPPPQILQPGNIAMDAWKTLEMLDKEIQDITHIFPESEGRVGEATSGFQTNLLQEAGDSIHEPDIRQHERAIEEAAIKIRRLMKSGYTIPRLLSLTGQHNEPEAMEFSAEDIDENAEIVVEAGSGLPQLKAARIQSLMELYNAGLLGNPQDPEVQRKTVQKLEMGTVDDAWREAREDDENALVENKDFKDGKDVSAPEFYQNHDIHYKTHTSQLKGNETRRWPEGQRLKLIAHIILHVKFVNPQSAILLANTYGMPQLVADLMAQQVQVAPGGAAPQGPPPAGQPGGAGKPAPGAPNPAQSASGAHQANPESGMGPQGFQASH